MTATFLDLLDAHKGRIALQFSGGRDSLAMLLALKPYWDLMTVYYCDSGDAFPETIALVGRVEGMVPKFRRVQGYSLETREAGGWPVDVLPSRSTFRGDVYAEPIQKFQGREICCFKSIMLPLQGAMIEDGITLILRGQRESDNPKSPMPNGATENGMTVFYPIADWTTAEVEKFILDNGEKLPLYYYAGMTSAPDCMHCTAWLEHGSYAFLRKFYPQMGVELRKRIKIINAAISSSASLIENIARD